MEDISSEYFNGVEGRFGLEDNTSSEDRNFESTRGFTQRYKGESYNLYKESYGSEHSVEITNTTPYIYPTDEEPTEDGLYRVDVEGVYTSMGDIEVTLEDLEQGIVILEKYSGSFQKNIYPFSMGDESRLRVSNDSLSIRTRNYKSEEFANIRTTRDSSNDKLGIELETSGSIIFRDYETGDGYKREVEDVNNKNFILIDETTGEGKTIPVPVGTERQVVSFDEDGKIISETLGWKHLSDLPSPPTFENGVYVGAGFDEDGSATFGFVELALDEGENIVKPNAIPIYNPGTVGTGGGTLRVEEGIDDKDAVNVLQLEEVKNGVVQTISATSSTQINTDTTLVVLTKRANSATGLLLDNVEKIEGKKIVIVNYNDNTGYWNFQSGVVHTPSGAEVRRVALETTSEITCINNEWILTDISLRDGVYTLDGWLHMAYLSGTYIVGNTGVNNDPTFNMVIDNDDNLDIRMTIKNVTPKPLTIKSYPNATNLINDVGGLVETITLPIGKTVSFIGTGTQWQQISSIPSEELFIKLTLDGNDTNTITYTHGLGSTPDFVLAQGLNNISAVKYVLYNSTTISIVGFENFPTGTGNVEFSVIIKP